MDKLTKQLWCVITAWQGQNQVALCRCCGFAQASKLHQIYRLDAHFRLGQCEFGVTLAVLAFDREGITAASRHALHRYERSAGRFRVVV